MKGISHTQAITFIHRHADGMLQESQRILLEEHLKSCDSCRAYSQQMELLPARVQQDLQSHLEKNPGPSPRVMQQVVEQASRIPADSRRSFKLRLLSGALALVALAFVINFVISRLYGSSVASGATPPVDTPVRAQDRLLAFTSDQNGNYDIYTMYADGSGLMNLTNHPAQDSYPFWSLDGKQIAFVSDRDGSRQIYLMDADGSNVVQLTHGDGNYALDPNNFTPWSPNGQKIIVSHKSTEDGFKLEIIDLTEGSTTTLTKDPGQYFLPSWSPDGSHVAFLSDTGPMPRNLSVVGSDGSQLTKLTENIPGSEGFISDYEWSADGASLFFATNQKMYSSTVEGSLTVIAEATDNQILSDWSNGGAVRLELADKLLRWVQPDGSQSTLDLCQNNGEMHGIAHKRSDHGSWMIGTNCSPGGWLLYWANPDGTTILPLSSSPLLSGDDNLFNMTWSPDDHYFAFVGSNITSPKATHTLYVLDVAKAREDSSIQPVELSNSFGPSWQPVIEKSVVEEKPTPKPASTGDLLAFSSNQNGNSEIYTMHADGSGLTNLTNNPEYDGFPYWSPDGRQIAFESSRDGSNQIYLMEGDGSNVIQLTHGKDGNGFLGGNIQTPWSPDGRKLTFAQGLTNDPNHQFYVMDVATSEVIPLTKEAGEYYSPLWSPDGGHIAFISDEANDPSPLINRHLYIVDSQGKQLTDLTGDLPENERLSFADYYWSPDGNSITFTTDLQSGSYKSTVYQASLDGSRVQVARTNQQILDWWNGITLQEDSPQKVDETSWSIVQADGSQASLSTCTSNDRFLAYYALKRSPAGHLFFGFNCTPSGWMLYGADSDGTNIHDLLSSSLDGKYDSLVNLSWSPDDHFLAFLALDGENTQLEDMYILNAKDPSAQPVKMEYSSSPSWQPVLSESIAKEKSPANLTIDPQSCKPAEGDSVPSELYGYDVIQNTSFTDGDFTYDFWLYCDPALKPNDPEHISAIAGLGIYSSWSYTGPQVDGPVQYYYALEPDEPFGTSGSDGPLYRASAKEKDGVYLSESRIQEYIQQGLPIRFRIVVDSSLGQDGAVLSFSLEPTQSGLSIVDVRASQLNTESPGKEEPTPDPTQNSYNGLVAFTSEQSGNLDIYTMRADGSQVKNLTNNPADDYGLLWSPDGQKIAFISERTGNPDIFVMDADGSNPTQLTDNPGYDGYLSWSPDGKKIIYESAKKDINQDGQLVLMDADGGNKTVLTDPGSFIFMGWSPDSKKIVFTKQNLDTTPLDNIVTVMNTDGTDYHEWNILLDKIVWEDDQHFIGEGQSPQEEFQGWVIYRLNANGEPPVEIASHSSEIYEFLRHTYVVGNGNTHTWYTLGNKAPIDSFNAFDVCRKAGEVSYTYEARTSTAPDESASLILVPCRSGPGAFYVNPLDGSEIRKLTVFAIGPDQEMVDVAWSPDGKTALITIADAASRKSDVYRFDIEKMLLDPATQPVRLTTDEAVKYGAVWQPVP